MAEDFEKDPAEAPEDPSAEDASEDSSPDTSADSVDVTADLDDPPSVEDLAEQQVEQSEDIYDEDVLAKEQPVPATAQPSGGVIPPVHEQVGPPITPDQAQQLAEQQAAIEAIAEATGWEGEKQPDPLAPSDEDPPEPKDVAGYDEEHSEPNPVEALAERDRFKDVDPEDAAELAAAGEGGAKVRQVAGASEESARHPLLQRPVEEQTGDATHQGSVRQEGATLPGERSVDNDDPAFQVAVNHVPGTPLPDDYYETAGPAPQPTLHEKVDTDALAAEDDEEGEDE